MEISEVMTSTVHTIYPDETVKFAAKLILDNNVGSIILQPRKGQKEPLGIITERDIVTRVVAVGKDPEKTAVSEIATKPVITAPPTLDIREAMTLMARMNIRRLIVVENNAVIGIVTYRDLLRVAPSLIEIASEYEKIGLGNQENSDYELGYEDYDEDSDTNPGDLSLGFYCSMCGEWTEGSPYGESEDEPICADCFENEN